MWVILHLILWLHAFFFLESKWKSFFKCGYSNSQVRFFSVLVIYSCFECINKMRNHMITSGVTVCENRLSYEILSNFLIMYINICLWTYVYNITRVGVDNVLAVPTTLKKKPHTQMNKHQFIYLFNSFLVWTRTIQHSFVYVYKMYVYRHIFKQMCDNLYKW